LDAAARTAERRMTMSMTKKEMISRMRLGEILSDTLPIHHPWRGEIGKLADILFASGVRVVEKPAQETVADRIRSLNDRDLGRFLCKFQGDCDECPATDLCSPGNSGMDEWLKLPAEGEDLE
jgi:hypothetical protein